MGQRFGLDAAIFSLKAYAASMLALYIAFSIGLERPYWAFLTSYIVAQPLAGAVISKAVFRIGGTLIGATVAVAMVPPLSNSPELLTLAIGLWLGFCAFISLLDRTPRAYMFVLAGYSAVLIAIPSVDHPGEIFTVASLRVQEITLGILCGSLIHAFVLPESVAEFLRGRVSAVLDDAERWSHDSLALDPDPHVDAERRRLAADITELHQLSIHLPFDNDRHVPRVRTVRALQDQLSMLMPLCAAVADRIATLRADDSLPPPVMVLLADTQNWLAASKTGDWRDGAEPLLMRCAELEPRIDGKTDWHDLIVLSLVARLATLIAAQRDCRDLAAQLAAHSRKPVTPRVAELLEGRLDRELHRDYAGAIRGGIGACITIVVGSALWIGSGWKDGGSAVMLAGVFLALFAASDNPLVPLKAFFWGTLAASILGCVYAYAIMPRLDGFVELAAAFAPPLLILGAMMHSPRWAGIAMPTLLGMGSPLLLSESYVSAFAPFINGAIAQLVGIMFAIMMVRLLQSAGVESAIVRTVKAGWNDIATRSNLTGQPDLRGWMARMLDRIALLAPRLALTGRPAGAPLYDALRDLRTGLAIGELRQLRYDLPTGETVPLTKVLRDVGAYYRQLDPKNPVAAGPQLLGEIDNALHIFTDKANPVERRAAALALVSLRRNLYPQAAAPVVAS